MRHYFHKCRRCGCSLDPGEGLFCEECEEEIRKESQKTEKKETAKPREYATA